MDNFSDYKFASISTEDNTKLTKLENTIKDETGKEVVLIAYEKKE